MHGFIAVVVLVSVFICATLFCAAFWHVWAWLFSQPTNIYLDLILGLVSTLCFSVQLIGLYFIAKAEGK